MSSQPIKFFGLVLTASLLTACSGTPTKKGTDDAAAVDSLEGGAGTTTRGVGGQGAWTGNPLDDPSSPLSTRTIYFELDSSDIRSEYVEVLRAHARYLASNPSARVTLEGHCDERGTREYNLALGARRANSVKDYLVSLGVSPSRITTISYGKERPAVLGSNEDAWSQNRRSVTVVTSGAAS